MTPTARHLCSLTAEGEKLPRGKIHQAEANSWPPKGLPTHCIGHCSGGYPNEGLQRGLPSNM